VSEFYSCPDNNLWLDQFHRAVHEKEQCRQGADDSARPEPLLGNGNGLSIRLHLSLHSCLTVHSRRGVQPSAGASSRRRLVSSTLRVIAVPPVSEIMRVTGLRKGGIYRHKDARPSPARRRSSFSRADKRPIGPFMRPSDASQKNFEGTLSI